MVIILKRRAKRKADRPIPSPESVEQTKFTTLKNRYRSGLISKQEVLNYFNGQ